MQAGPGIETSVRRRHHRLPVRGRNSVELFREAIALTIGALLPIMNPFSTAPLFIALTTGMDRKARNRQALLACIYAFGILVVFLLLGSAIIDFFRISIPGLRTAGGLIMSAIGFRMLFPASPAHTGAAPQSQQELDIAFTPLAMPSLAGPGSISVVLTAAPQIKSIHPDDRGLVYVGVVIGNDSNPSLLLSGPSRLQLDGPVSWPKRH